MLYLNYISENFVSNFKFIQRICGFNLFFDRLLLQKNLFLRKKKGQSAIVSNFTFNLKILWITTQIFNDFICRCIFRFVKRIVSNMFSAVSLAPRLSVFRGAKLSKFNFFVLILPAPYFVWLAKLKYCKIAGRHVSKWWYKGISVTTQTLGWICVCIWLSEKMWRYEEWERGHDTTH